MSPAPHDSPSTTEPSACEALVVTTHWIHPEVHDYLSRFSTVDSPTAEQQVFSRAETLERARTARGLVTCMADSVDDRFLPAPRGAPRRQKSIFLAGGSGAELESIVGSGAASAHEAAYIVAGCRPSARDGPSS